MGGKDTQDESTTFMIHGWSRMSLLTAVVLIYLCLFSAPVVGSRQSQYLSKGKRETWSPPLRLNLHTRNGASQEQQKVLHLTYGWDALGVPSITQLPRADMSTQDAFSNLLRLRAGGSSSTTSLLESLMDSFRSELLAIWRSLLYSLRGVKGDSLLLLFASALVIPAFKAINTSPIIGFLMIGTLLGPSGLSYVQNTHKVEMLGELGIVLFLFEMGLELSLDKLKAMRSDVFGLGTGQFLLTSAVGALLARQFGLSPAAAVTVGGSLALSSSAFVLQLLKDKGELNTRHGRASFGILLLQDLAVVPLLIVVGLLSEGGARGLGKALCMAAAKACLALAGMGVVGKCVLAPLFSVIADSGSREAFLGLILGTVLLFSYTTQGIGLSDTLGAFVAGLVLAGSKHRHQIEKDIEPLRGLLLGLFFTAVGFNIDLLLISREYPTILALLLGMIAVKTAIITAVSTFAGLSLHTAVRTGLLNSQGGELGFVAFAIAERAGLISPRLNKRLLTTVALSMAATPVLAEVGTALARRLGSSRSSPAGRTTSAKRKTL